MVNVKRTFLPSLKLCIMNFLGSSEMRGRNILKTKEQESNFGFSSKICVEAWPCLLLAA